MATKLTKAKIEAAKPKSSRYILWDSAIPGFGCCVLPSGRKTFLLKYRTADGEQRKPSIGVYGALTLIQAREIAQDMLAGIRGGKDPSQARKEARKAPTVSDLCDRYLTEHAKLKKRPLSVRVDRINIDRHIKPRLGRRKVAKVQYEDIEQLHRDMHETPGAANRVLSLLSKMFNLAEKWRWREPATNSCKHISRYKERKLHRDLTELELARLAKTLLEAEGDDPELQENPRAIAAIRLLIFTGCRRNEILHLKWSEVDLERGFLHLEESKTGEKSVYLNSAARDVLQAQEKVLGNPHVFPGIIPGKPIHDLNGPWYRLRKRAGLEDVRLHDLRHNYASAAASGGLSLTVIGKLLGHHSPITTSRYADLADDPARAAAEMVGRKLSEAMKGDTEKAT